MQPIANMKPRAALTQSAPSAITATMSKALMILPLAPSLMRSRKPAPTSVLCTNSRPSRSGTPRWSENSSGAAPVPPSLPSTTMKSGSDAGRQHRLDDAHELPRLTDAQLETHRLAAGQLAQPGDERHQLQRRGKRAVPRRRDAVLADRHAAGGGDFRVSPCRPAGCRHGPAWRPG